MAQSKENVMALSIEGVVYAIKRTNLVKKGESRLIFPESVLVTIVDFLNISRRYAAVYGTDLEEYRGNHIQVYEFCEDLESGILLMQDVYFYGDRVNRSVSIWEPNSFGGRKNDNKKV